MASRLKRGDVVALKGELGAGKTTLVKVAARKLGVEKLVNSPTYLIYKEYPIDEISNLVHIDAYRLKNNNIDLLNIQEIFNKNNIVFIEWADKIKKILPKNTIWVTIEIDGKERRIIKEK